MEIDAAALAAVFDEVRASVDRCEAPFRTWTYRELSTFKGGFVGRLPEGRDCFVISRRGEGEWGGGAQGPLLPNDCASGDCRSVCVPWTPDEMTPVDGHCSHPDLMPYAGPFGAPGPARYISQGERCVPPQPVGTVCDGNDVRCLSLNCEDDRCAPPRELGAACRDHVECESGVCLGWELCSPGDFEEGVDAVVFNQCRSHSIVRGVCAPGICDHLTWAYAVPPR